MSNEVMLFDQQSAPLSSKFNQIVAAGEGNDLGDGIRGSYGIISIKSGRFRIKYKGQETMLTAGGNPVAAIDVVIVKANGYLNKQYYAGKYVEGSNSPPDCYSLDGKAPSSQAKSPQHTNCELCPKNQWGSLIGDNGQKQKACRDTKKLAIVPVADIKNLSFGGAMLFRVPPSSLKDLSTMADALKGRGYPYNSVAVRIGFDMSASHPKPTFKAIRTLTDDEADAVLAMYQSDSVERVLADTEVALDDGALATHEPRVQPVVQAQAAPPPVATTSFAAAAAAPAPAPAPVPQAVPEPPTVLVATPIPAGPAVVVQPFNPGAAPPPLDPSIFAAPVAAAPVPQSAPQAPAAPPSAAPKAPAAPPSVAAPAAPAAAEPTPNALEADIGSILAGLSQFTAGK